MVNGNRMKYYQITNQIGTIEVGKNIYPQTDGLVGKNTFNSTNSFSIFNHHNLPENFKAQEKIKLAHSANKTDFISTAIISGHGFIISDNVRKLLDEHHIVNHKYYELPLIQKNQEIKGYYWFQMYEPKQEYVVFSKSKFQVRRFSKIIKDEIVFKSIDDYWEQKRNYKPGELFRSKIIYIKPNDLDFLYLGVGDSKYLISEKLKKRMEEINITGYELNDNLSNIKIEDYR